MISYNLIPTFDSSARSYRGRARVKELGYQKTLYFDNKIIASFDSLLGIWWESSDPVSDAGIEAKKEFRKQVENTCIV